MTLIHAHTRHLGLVLAVFAAGALPALARPLPDPPPPPKAPAYTWLRADVDTARHGGGRLRWVLDGWHGGDWRKLWIHARGERRDHSTEAAEAQVLHARYIAPFWDALLGLRRDLAPRGLTQAAIGVRGLAPFRFDTEATIFVGERGRIGARLELEHAILFTQRLIAAPYLDAERSAGRDALSGARTEGAAGLRLRYEIQREIAPYLDAGWQWSVQARTGDQRFPPPKSGGFALGLGLRLWY